MANQLNQFANHSETRWPLPDLPEEASGGNRKALSRYIGQCIARLEARDVSLRQQRMQTSPNRELEAPPKVRMSRKEYIKKQNQLYKQLTGENSFAAHSEKVSQLDQKNAKLMASLELYMAALDEKIYISADHTRAMIGIRDKEVRDQYDELTKEGAPPLIYKFIELRDMYRDLWMQHSQLSSQRDSLEIEAANLRYDQALQLGKVSKLQYATQCLSQKLVNAQKQINENEELKTQLAQQQQQIDTLKMQNESLELKFNEQSELLKKLTLQTNNHAPKDVELRIHELFLDVCKLKAAEGVKEADTPLKELETAFKTVEILKTEQETKLSQLILAFGQQYKTRETELLATVAKLEAEREVLLARYDKISTERDATVKDLSFLEERTLSLVYLLKTARASLDSMGDDDEKEVEGEDEDEDDEKTKIDNNKEDEEAVSENDTQK